MNKVIFQIGLLSFFVAVVIFGLQGSELIDLVARSFIVFIGVVLALTCVFAVSTYFGRQTVELQKEQQRQAAKQASSTTASS